MISVLFEIFWHYYLINTCVYPNDSGDLQFLRTLTYLIDKKNIASFLGKYLKLHSESFNEMHWNLIKMFNC